MAVDLNTFVKQLADSGIIAPGKLADFVPPKATPKDAQELARQLVQSNQLTKYQAQEIAQGRGKSLILGAYTILDKIGAGGMGQVFKAQHRKMKRLVAIKMLPAAMMQDAAAAARFEREVEAAAKLRHPNIVAADDAAEANGVHFLVMEYVEGDDLSVLVKKNGPFPVGKAVNYIQQAARGLEFAHSQGVVHRDIKPANLLLDKTGTVKILDMGLARIEGEAADHQLTSSGTIMGTVDYMAPEQAINTKNADHRADIYSLGISLYYLLAGKPAYSGDTAIEKLMAHQTQPIPSLQDVQTTVPKPLDAVFKKMVAKKIEDRYQSMGEVIEALEGLGFGGSETRRKGDVASTMEISPEQKKQLAAQAKKKPLGAITDVVASEKTKHLALKILGGTFATIIAPMLVAFLIRYVEKGNAPAVPPQTLLPVGEGGRRPDEGAPRVDNPVALDPPHPGPRPETKTLTPYEILTSPEYEWTEPENLGPTVNTRANEVEPTLSADGLTLIFNGYGRGGGVGKLCQAVRSSVDQPFEAALPLPEIVVEAKHPSLSGDGLTLVYIDTDEKKNVDLWQATRRSPRDPFDPPALLTELNSSIRDEAPFLSADGLTIVFISDRPGRISGGHWISRRASRDAPFDPPQPFVFPWVSGMATVYGKAVSSDERVLIFATSTPPNVPPDLWMAARPTPNAPFAAPVKLPAPINTAEREQKMPTLSADGSVLIFVSDPPGGLGGTDLWQTRRVRKKAAAAPSASVPAGGANSGDLDRAVAEWVIAGGGEVIVFNAAGRIKKITDLPPQPFLLSRVMLGNNQQITLADAQRLAALTQLGGVENIGGEITAQMVSELRNSPRLQSLSFSSVQFQPGELEAILTLKQLRGLTFSVGSVPDAYVARLGELPNLRGVRLYGDKGVTDQGLIGLAKSPPPKLASLDLALVNNVTATGLSAVATLPHLQRLVLGKTKIDDQTLRALAAAKGLAELNLEETQVTRAGVDWLHETLDHCHVIVSKVEQAGTLNGPASQAAIRKLLARGFTFQGHVGIAPVSLKLDAPWPDGGPIRVERATLPAAASVDDLRDLAQLRDLQEIDMRISNRRPASWMRELLPLKNLTVLLTGVVPLSSDEVQLLLSFPKLRGVHVCVTDDASIARIAKLPHLTQLTISPNSKITDACLDSLKGVATLETLSLHPPITRPAAEAFAAVRPDVTVTWKLSAIELPASIPAGGANSGDLDRAVAEWVIAGGGEVDVFNGPGHIKNLADLPAPPYLLSGVYFGKNQQLTPADVRRLAALPRLRQLQFNSGEITPQMIAELRAFPRLGGLSFERTQFQPGVLVAVLTLKRLVQVAFTSCSLPDAFVARLGELPNLRVLRLYGVTAITDEGLIGLANSPPPNLAFLNLTGVPKVTAAGLAAIAALPHLEKVYLAQKKWDDEALRALAAAKGLSEIRLTETQVTRAGVDWLHETLGNCQVRVSTVEQAGKLNGPAYQATVRKLLARGFAFQGYVGNSAAVPLKQDVPWPDGGPITVYHATLPATASVDDFRELAQLLDLLEISIPVRSQISLPAGWVRELLPLKNLTQLSTGDVPLTGDEVQLLHSFPKLRSVSVCVTEDASIASIAKLPHLTNLTIDAQSKITDACLNSLKGVATLETLSLLPNSPITRRAAEAFAAARPDVTVMWNDIVLEPPAAPVVGAAPPPPAVPAALPLPDGPPGKVWSVGPKRVSNAYFLNNGNLLARDINTWGVVDPRTGARQTSVNFKSPVPQIGTFGGGVLSPDQRWFVFPVYSADKTKCQFCLADAQSGQLLRNLLDEQGSDTFSIRPSALSVSLDGRRIVVAFNDAAPKSSAVFDVDSGKLIKRLANRDTGDGNYGPSLLGFAPDGKLAAIDDSGLCLIDLDQEIRQLVKMPVGYRRALALSADGRRAVIAGTKAVNKVDVAYLAVGPRKES